MYTFLWNIHTLTYVFLLLENGFSCLDDLMFVVGMVSMSITIHIIWTWTTLSYVCNDICPFTDLLFHIFQHCNYFIVYKYLIRVCEDETRLHKSCVYMEVVSLEHIDDDYYFYKKTSTYIPYLSIKLWIVVILEKQKMRIVYFFF